MIEETNNRESPCGGRASNRARHPACSLSFEVRIRFFIHHWRQLCCLLLSTLVVAATDTKPDEIPPLRPPRPEIPPGFWEAHRVSLTISTVIFLIIIGIALWFTLRARPRAEVPPEIQARKALDALKSQPESGVLLSNVSQILRRYVMAAHGLPAGELTTTEFCAAISAHPSIGTQLSAAIGEFLRCCDQRKFAPDSDGVPLDAVASALKFVEQSEQRRSELHRAQQPA